MIESKNYYEEDQNNNQLGIETYRSFDDNGSPMTSERMSSL